MELAVEEEEDEGRKEQEKIQVKDIMMDSLHNKNRKWPEQTILTSHEPRLTSPKVKLDGTVGASRGQWSDDKLDEVTWPEGLLLC